MKRVSIYILIISNLLIGGNAIAQQDQDQDKVENIEVLGKVPTSRLKKLVTKATLDFYDTFNSINTVEEYRVICRYESQAGTNFRTLKCQPQYYKDKAWELSKTLANGSITDIPDRVRPEHVVAATKEIKAESDAHTIKLIEENPVLWEKYQELLKANKTLQERQAPK